MQNEQTEEAVSTYTKPTEARQAERKRGVGLPKDDHKELIPAQRKWIAAGKTRWAREEPEREKISRGEEKRGKGKMVNLIKAPERVIAMRFIKTTFGKFRSFYSTSSSPAHISSHTHVRARARALGKSRL